jgi:hypothetical protein
MLASAHLFGSTRLPSEFLSMRAARGDYRGAVADVPQPADYPAQSAGMAWIRL